MSKKGHPIIFSFFSGCGFLDLGFEMSNFEIQFINESHKPFLDAYKYSREQMQLHKPKYGYHQGSIEELVTGDKTQSLSQWVADSKKSAFVGFIGGPPCPDFSIAGKQKGAEGENGKLSKVYFEAIIQNKPDFFLFENVKGLWKTNKHRAFYDEMKTKLEKADYLLIDRLTNSIEFGVPQDRDRIFLFGIHKKSIDKKYSKKNLAKDFNWGKEIKFAKEEALSKKDWPTVARYQENQQLNSPDTLNNMAELTVEYWFNKNEVYTHPNSQHFFKPRQGLLKFQTIAEGDVSRKSFKRLHRYRYSPTAAYGNNEVHLHPYKSRRLSAAEALAIQSLPKEFHFPSTMSLSNMFKTIGNGVPYLVSKGIANSIYSFLDSVNNE